MIKITIEGFGARLIGRIVHKALEAAGVKANYWHSVTPKEVASCRREATVKGADVSIVAMRAGNK